MRFPAVTTAVPLLNYQPPVRPAGCVQPIRLRSWVECAYLSATGRKREPFYRTSLLFGNCRIHYRRYSGIIQSRSLTFCSNFTGTISRCRPPCPSFARAISRGTPRGIYPAGCRGETLTGILSKPHISRHGSPVPAHSVSNCSCPQSFSVFRKRTAGWNQFASPVLPTGWAAHTPL